MPNWPQNRRKTSLQLMKPLRKTQTNMVRKNLQLDNLNVKNFWRTVQLLLQWNCKVILRQIRLDLINVGNKQVKWGSVLRTWTKCYSNLYQPSKLYYNIKDFEDCLQIYQTFPSQFKTLVEKFAGEVVTQLWESLLLLTLVMLEKDFNFH